MSAPVSNVRVVSNVYPVTIVRKLSLPGWTGYSGVCDDRDFCRQIRGKAALKKLAQATGGANIYERAERQNLLDARVVAKWQVEVYWDQEGAGRCVDCPLGERPFGIIRTGSKCKVVNRCENPHCRCRP